MRLKHDPTFWSGRRVLVTGHTGFKGTWLSFCLRGLGADVHGVSLPGNHGDPSLWNQAGVEGVSETRADIAGQDWLDDVRAFSPEVVLHLAAQSLVSEGYRDPVTTFRTNVQGTVQLLDLLEELKDLRATVVVTTDKVYDPSQAPPYDEGHLLGGKDPYSASKACAELVTHSWPHLATPVATARAGNVIGGGDWSVNRILPDIVRAWSDGEELVLRRPDAVRPWQHVVEPLAGYLSYVERLAAGDDMPSALNFGPHGRQSVPVLDLVEFASKEWSRLTGGPGPAWRVEREPSMAETKDLTLDPSLARESLGWGGRWTWQEATTRTLEWYVGAAHGAHPGDLIRADLAAYFD